MNNKDLNNPSKPINQEETAISNLDLFPSETIDLSLLDKYQDFINSLDKKEETTTIDFLFVEEDIILDI